MLEDDFYNEEDQYRNRVLSHPDLNPNGGGIAGPQDFPTPAVESKPKGGYDLEGIRKRLGFGQVDLSNTGSWLDANRDVAEGVSIRGDKMYDPTGKYLADVISKSKQGGTRSQFLDGIDSNTGQKRTAAPKVSTSGAPAAAAPAASPMSGFNAQVRQLLMGRLQAMSKAPSIDDPALAAQSQAFSRGQQRSNADERAMLAERAAANGTLAGGQSSGGFDTALQGIHERSGERQAANDAGLVGNEVQARRNEVQSLMQMALQSGDNEMARQLQMQLAQLDAQLRRESMAQQGSQFNAQLGQQNSQFNDTFGYAQGRDAESDYRWRVLQAMGGV